MGTHLGVTSWGARGLWRARHGDVAAAAQAQARAKAMATQSPAVSAARVGGSAAPPARTATSQPAFKRTTSQSRGGAAAEVLRPSNGVALAAYRACMAKMQTDGLCGDITLQVTGGHGTVPAHEATLPAHSSILMAHSSVFAGLLHGQPRGQAAAPIRIGYSLQAVRVALQFCKTPLTLSIAARCALVIESSVAVHRLHG